MLPSVHAGQAYPSGRNFSILPSATLIHFADTLLWNGCSNNLPGIVLVAGVYNTAQLVKAYFRSMFGKGSAQDKDVSSLEFIKR
jgi:hypothetical protein